MCNNCNGSGGGDCNGIDSLVTKCITEISVCFYQSKSLIISTIRRMSMKFDFWNHTSNKSKDMWNRVCNSLPEKHLQQGEHPHTQQENEKPAHKWNEKKHIRCMLDKINVLSTHFLYKPRHGWTKQNVLRTLADKPSIKVTLQYCTNEISNLLLDVSSFL